MADTLRLDKFLWFARISASRAFAQKLAESGRLRISGRIVDRAHCPVRVGDILTFATHLGRIRVLRVEALPARRGPPAEARALYMDLNPPPNGEGDQPQAGEGGPPHHPQDRGPPPPPPDGGGPPPRSGEDF